VQRVVTIAGDSLVGTKSGGVTEACDRGEKGYRPPRGMDEKRRSSGEKALQIAEKSFMINGFCNKL